MTEQTQSIGQDSPVFNLIDVSQLDQAVEVAGRRTNAVIGIYGAAPANDDSGIDLALEFIVPPADLAAFGQAVDEELREHLPYHDARRGGLATVGVLPLPPGSFHQWRHIWRRKQAWLQAQRWSNDRTMLDGVIRQAEIGWRELLTAV